MSVRDLNETDRDIAFQCLRYFVKSGCFDIRDKYHTRLGVTKANMELMLSAWPDIQDDDASQYASWGMNNCFNEVCNIQTFSPAEWDKWFTVPESEVCQAYQRWCEIRKRVDPTNAGGGVQ